MSVVLDVQQNKQSSLQSENLCLRSALDAPIAHLLALDALIASSISQSADSVVILDQTVLLS